MLPFNRDALRVRLTTDFRSLARGVEDASEITRILNLLTNETASILRGLVLEWSNENDLLGRLPSELLAICFAFLPFRDRITASHVSRAWRAISLAHPAIWADIPVFRKFKGEPRLLRMALSRTGNHPVVIRGTLKSDSDRIIAQCLREHLPHIQHLKCTLRSDLLPLSVPAPMLTTISRVAYHLELPADFLGGRPARLKTVHLSTVSFPSTCPALSTLKTLTLDGPRERPGAGTYAHLFDLCPNLQWLRLLDLAASAADLLPRGRAPSSLRRLDMVSYDDGYDMTPHALAWRTDNLDDIRLDQEAHTLPHLEELLSGFITLTFGLEYGIGRAYVFACDRRHVYTVFFQDLADDAARAAPMVLAARAGLQNVTELEVPVSAFSAFLPVLPVLPALKLLGICIRVRALQEGECVHAHPSGSLPALSCARDACPGLKTIVLRVACLGEGDQIDDAACPLTVLDAYHVLELISALGSDPLPHICIKGFSADVDRAMGLELPLVNSCTISFDNS